MYTDLIFHVHILGAYVHDMNCLCQEDCSHNMPTQTAMMMMTSGNNTRRIIHDCIRCLVFMPNEPKVQQCSWKEIILTCYLHQLQVLPRFFSNSKCRHRPHTFCDQKSENEINCSNRSKIRLYSCFYNEKSSLQNVKLDLHIFVRGSGAGDVPS